MLPFLPNRYWFNKFVGVGKLFQIKYYIPYNMKCIVACGSTSFKSATLESLQLNDTHLPLTCPTSDMVIVEANPHQQLH